MAKAKTPSLALDLARQAAAAAKAEVQDESEESPQAPAVGASFQAWKPYALPEGFLLAPALAKAVDQVAGHLAKVLHYEGLEVAAVPQGVLTKEAGAMPASAVQVVEGGNGRVVRGYSVPALLGMFASQQQRTGVVVDGQV